MIYEGFPGFLRNNFVYNTNFLIHKINRVFNYLPFFLADLTLLIRGQKLKFIQSARQFHQGADVLEYFATRDWNFKNENFKKLVEHSKNQDGNFDCDIEPLQWEQFIKEYVEGVDRYFMKKKMEL
jgi:fatty acyl-CoA reductase